jgi:uncharacterized membrane protein
MITCASPNSIENPTLNTHHRRWYKTPLFLVTFSFFIISLTLIFLFQGMFLSVTESLAKRYKAGIGIQEQMMNAAYSSFLLATGFLLIFQTIFLATFANYFYSKKSSTEDTTENI